MAASRDRDVSEALEGFLSTVARAVFGLGGVSALLSAALLFFTIFRLGDASAAGATADAVRNVGLGHKVLLAGVVASAIGALVLFWGSEFLGFGLLVSAAALYFAPAYLPSLTSSNDTNPAVIAAYRALQEAGTVLGVIGVLALVVDVVIRVKSRAKEGVKAENLKFGKGIKEDADRQNVFLGKCWQMPFCRKFVRERCPIFHAKVTCWKERTGCMCEEEVIRGAMENKPIPKDQLLASKMIPRNHRLSDAQKAERCKNCVIYNEHLRQLYKVRLPMVVGGWVILYIVLHGPLVARAETTVKSVNQVLHGLTLGAAKQQDVPQVFVELLVGVFFLVALTYSLRLLEWLMFKVKV